MSDEDRKKVMNQLGRGHETDILAYVAIEKKFINEETRKSDVIMTLNMIGNYQTQDLFNNVFNLYNTSDSGINREGKRKRKRNIFKKLIKVLNESVGSHGMANMLLLLRM
ncbi:hypothetical protein OCOL_000720 [Ordospora colligata]